ncbi:MAG: TIGR04500 family putative peptide maturation system protein [Chloroflexota bacterium]|nr:TIGR04500 family putative peptide maturation system protein [Chloroflexota bacterium]
MIDILPSALTDALTCLTDLNRDRSRPEQALARIRSLQERYPAIRIDLLWEEETYDDSLHYDILMRRPDEGTISLAYCPDRALPWPTRGVQRWSEGHLMRVNGKVVRVAQAVACMDFIWDEAPVAERLVNASLVQAELERDPVDLSREQIQRAMDAFRRRRRLFTAEETLGWMRDRGLTPEHLERLVADEAAVVALRDRVVADRVESWFEQHQADFDTVSIARCTFPDEASAAEGLHRIRNGSLDFYELAQARFLDASPTNGDLFSAVGRGTVSPAFEERVFAAAPGDLVGPICTDEDVYAVIRILGVSSGRLDESTRRKIKQILFDAWLDQRRRDAIIEWYWGTDDHTARTA